jgi:hypothetical protein
MNASNLSVHLATGVLLASRLLNLSGSQLSDSNNVDVAAWGLWRAKQPEWIVDIVHKTQDALFNAALNRPVQ